MNAMVSLKTRLGARASSSPLYQRWQQLPPRDRLALNLLAGFLALVMLYVSRLAAGPAPSQGCPSVVSEPARAAPVHPEQRRAGPAERRQPGRQHRCRTAAGAGHRQRAAGRPGHRALRQRRQWPQPEPHPGAVRHPAALAGRLWNSRACNWPKSAWTAPAPARSTPA